MTISRKHIRVYWLLSIPLFLVFLASGFLMWDAVNDEERTAWQIYWMSREVPPEAAANREFLVAHPEFGGDRTLPIAGKLAIAAAVYLAVGLALSRMGRARS